MQHACARLTRRLLFGAAIIFAPACGSDSGSNPNPNNGSISLSLGTSSGTVAQGSALQVAATLTRGGGFTGNVSITVEGAPTGLLGTVGNVQTAGTTTTATVSLAAAGSLTPGTFPLTVRARGTGVADVTASYSLTVTATTGSSYSIAVAPTAVSVLPGASTPVVVTLNRTGFVGSVFLALTGAPAGVTGTFSANNITTNTATMTLNVGAAVAAGIYTVFVGGVAAGQPDKVTPIQLTVGTAGTFTLSLPAATASIAQGATSNIATTVTRAGGFAAAVALTVTGQPAGLTASFSPASTTGTTSTLTLTAGAALAPGTYALTIRGNSTGVTEQTTPLMVTVTTSGGGGVGNVTLNFASCSATQKPVWLAYQDGTGTVTRVTGSGDVYQFNVTSGKGGYFYVTQNGASTSVVGLYFTQPELTAAPIVVCTPATGKTVNGTAAGIALGESASLTLDGASATASTNGAFQFTNVANGTFDFVGYRRSFLAPGASDRMILRRDQNIASGGSLTVADFGSAEAFAPAQATLTVNGGTAQLSTMAYLTGASCSVASLYANVTAPSPIYGVAAGQQRASDFHYLTVISTSGNVSRIVSEVYNAFGNRTVTLGATPGVPTITPLTAGFKRLQAAFTIPTGYQSSTNFQYRNAASDRVVSIGASFGWLGGAAATLPVPDLGAAAGWNNAWAPASGSTVDYTVSMTGSNIVTSLCQEGGRLLTASVNGTN